jgi:hypothetical protein
VCAHHGYPLYPIPGANIFLTAEDETTPDGAITCKQISEADALRLAGHGLVWLGKLAELLG